MRYTRALASMIMMIANDETVITIFYAFSNQLDAMLALEKRGRKYVSERNSMVM